MTPSGRPSDREERVNEAVAAYLEAAEQGRAPDESEFLVRYSDVRGELEAFFQNRRQFAAAAQQHGHAGWRAGQGDLLEKLASFPGVNDRAGRPAPSPPAGLPPGGTGRGPQAEAPTLAPDQLQGAAPVTRVRYFGDYELLDEIAKGGMGVVWRARQVSLNRTVALKMILAGQFASEAEVQRFRLEAESAANLDHPNIVPIYEIGDHRGEQYYTMKLIEGTSLARSIAAGQWPSAAPDTQQRIARLLVPVARAVHHAHRRGILHRDLKPGNVLIDRGGQPHVTDFGLAKRADGAERLPNAQGAATPAPRPRGAGGLAARSMTLAGEIVGTPSYMPPEQAAGKKDLTVAADVYSLGAILYELLTGRPPFRAASELETLVQVLESEPHRPAAVAPGVDPDLESICLKCLEKDPERRYPSAESLAADLERWLSLETVQARNPTRGERIRRFYKRHGRAAILGTLLIAWTLLVPLFFLITAHTRGAGSFLLLVLNLANVYLAYYYVRFAGGNAVPLPGSPAYRLALARRALDAFAPLPRMAFSPDGQRLAVAAGGQPIKVWSREVRADPLVLGSHAKKVTALAFSPDGGRLASGAWDRTVKLWTVSETKVSETVIRSPSTVQSLVFRPDGKLVAGACVDGIVRVWDAADGRQVNSLE